MALVGFKKAIYTIYGIYQRQKKAVSRLEATVSLAQQSL